MSITIALIGYKIFRLSPKEEDSKKGRLTYKSFIFKDLL